MNVNYTVVWTAIDSIAKNFVLDFKASGCRKKKVFDSRVSIK